MCYSGFRQDLSRDCNLPVHLHVDELGPGTGDPLSRIEMAVLRLKMLQKKRSAPAERFTLLDFDQAERDPQRAERARTLAADNGIMIFWQRRSEEHTSGLQSLMRISYACFRLKKKQK